MLTQKILENWLYWLVIDSVAIVLYWHAGYLATVILFVLYIILGIYAYVTWKKEYYPINLKPYKLFDNEEIETLNLLKQQGHCNINYQLTTDKKKYLIRKFKYQGNRKAEFYIQNLAYKKDIAAKALLLDEENKLMVCDYIEGEHHFKLKQQELKKLALTLSKLHRLKIQQQPHTFKDSFKYKDKKAYDAFRVIKKIKPEYVVGHNDLHPKNILFGKKVKFIDWEYAGKADRYFDLAAIIIEFKLNKKDEQTFLRSYFSRNAKVNPKKLKAFKTIYSTLWTVWFGKLERGQIETV
jgi:thiamine kinase-like enzyme